MRPLTSRCARIAEVDNEVVNLTQLPQLLLLDISCPALDLVPLIMSKYTWFCDVKCLCLDKTNLPTILDDDISGVFPYPLT